MPAVNRYYSSTAVDTTLTGPITNVATSMVVASVSGWPTSYPYTVILDEGTATEEVVSVTAAAGTTLTISRSQDGTSGVAHSTGATARHGVSARDFTEPQNHIAGNSGVHGVSGNVVGATDAQALTNKDLSSGTNTFPSSLATLTTAQALTHKDLTDATNTFPSTLVATSGNQTISGSKTFNGGSGATPSLIIAPTSDTYALKIVRGTDTSPTQPLFQIRDHADAGNVFAVDAVGNCVASNKIQSFLGDFTRSTLGTFFGGNDQVTLNVKRGTDSSPTQDIIQVTNQAGSSTFFKIDANGNVTVANQLSVAGADVSGAWTSYTPTWTATTTNPTLGNGTLTGYYKQLGKTVYFECCLTIGSTTSGGAGSWLFALPVQASSHYQLNAAIGNGAANQSSGVGSTVCGRYKVGGTTVDMITGGGFNVDPTHPGAWSSGQSLTLSGVYEAA